VGLPERLEIPGIIEKCQIAKGRPIESGDVPDDAASLCV
jgi:hypothetical protein